MKRFFITLLALPLMAGMIASCENTQLEEEESVEIEGLETSYSFPAVPTEDVTFTITSNVKWAISVENLDWVDISPSNGLGDGKPVTVVISASINKDVEASRSGSFTLTAGTVKSTCTLTQAAADVDPAFYVTGVENDVFEIEALNVEGASFSVSSNCDWTAALQDMSWATVSPLTGTKDCSATITIVPKAANDGDAVSGTISFDYGAAAPKVVTIVHKKFQPELAISVEALVASRSGKIADPVVTVTSNANWTAACSEDWLSVDKAEGPLGETAVTVTAGANETGQQRTATVTFSNKDLKKVLTVTQGNEYVEVTKETISTQDTEVTIEIKSNVAWTITSSETWATVNPASGTGDAVVTVTMSQLAIGMGNRTTQLTIAATEIEELAAVVALEQKEPSNLNFIDLYETPVLFLSNNQAINVRNNPDFATTGLTGSEAVGGSGKGTGHLKSYSHYDNADIYMQFTTPHSHGPQYIIAAEGSITVRNTWTDDAFEFHIPVTRILAGQVLNFEYGLYGTSGAPSHWNSEVSLDGGKTWESFDTGNVSASPNNGAASNSVTAFSQKVEMAYHGQYVLPVTVERADLIVRVRCTDGTYQINKKTASGPSASAAIRIIGGAGHDVEGDATSSEMKGPKLYVTSDTSVVLPELNLSASSLTATGTTVSFNVTSNVEWTAVASESWASVSPASGSGNGAVTVTLSELAPGASNRTVLVTVTAVEAGISENVVIEQIAPAPAGPDGNYVDLLRTPVLYNSNDQAWNITNNPDYATAGQTGAKPAGDPGQGSGKGTGRVQSYSHYANPEVFMQFEDADAGGFAGHCLYIMAAEGNITAKEFWTDDAFVFHTPMWKAEAGQTLYFDFSFYGKGKNTPKYYMVEVSINGGQTWTKMTTDMSGISEGNGAESNFVFPKNESIVAVSATYKFAAGIEKADIRVRLRCVDGSYTVGGTTRTTPVGGSYAVRMLGYDQGTLSGDASKVQGPQIYIK